MKRSDIAAILGLVALVALFFAPVLFGGAVLVPFDNLFRFPPWSAFAAQFGITQPKNELVLDLVLENFVWKEFLVNAFQAHEIPLWNPYLFAGIPFLAAGQHSALYPLSLLFYVLPVDRAFGLFVALQIAIAAIGMYALGRVLGMAQIAALVSSIVYALSGFMVVSTTFPMVLAAAAWLPGILACIELVLRDGIGSHGLGPSRFLWTIIGAVLIGVQFLAGHIETSLYVLLVAAFFAFVRGIAIGIRRSWHGWLLVAGMTVIGSALAAVQLIPLYELVSQNFRSGSVTFQNIVEWAYKPRQILTFLIPDFFGNPTHHAYLDVFDWKLRNAPTGTVFWGIKNYVEAGSYVGVFPLVLACIALFFGLRKLSTAGNANRARPYVFLFAGLAVISLLFVFGTPFYAILFFGFPGFNQLHTPFRWVFPYTLCMAVLAGFGFEIVKDSAVRSAKRIIGTAGLGLVASGGLVASALLVSLFFGAPAIALAERLVRSSNLASATFSDGRMFFSYEFRNLLLFALNALAGGVALWLAYQGTLLPRRFSRLPLWQPFAVAIISIDLYVLGSGFYPTADPRLGDFTPPSIQFLKQDQSLFRITTYDRVGGPEEKILNMNAGMLYGIADIRGYDSIIPRQYAELMGLLAPQNQLLDNRIAPFYDPDPLSSPLVNLLNVKYVLTQRPLPNAGFSLVYDGEIQIYRNDHVLPRAFMVPQARVITDSRALLEEMKTFDPTREVLIDRPPALESIEVRSRPDCSYAPIQVEKYAGSEVILSSNQTCSGWLVLSDSYFPGWIAQIDDVDTSLYRADHNFRAVYVPTGTHAIRFKYSPLSLRVGAVASFLAGMLVLFGLALVTWQRFYRPTEESEVRRVAKNSLVPMGTALVLKTMDLIYALFWLRMLGPTGTGRYTWAVDVWFFANTITDFGLGILLTREVSKDRSQANRYLTNSLLLRVALWLISLLPFALVANVFQVTIDTTLALWLFLLSILPSSLSASLAFLFNAFEKFEYRVAVDVMTRFISISLGVIALLLGYGIVGLGVVSILTNLVTLAAFYILVRRTLFVPRFEPDKGLVRRMFFESYPLMLNNLLSSLFFRIDVFILQPLKGDTDLGYYSTAYKFIDALNVIPSNFTLAIFPALTRMADSAKDGMLRAFVLSLKLLLWIALPITTGTIFVSRELIGLIGGEGFLPHSAIALQILIWFLPFSFINSVTHYVLIALGQQRFLTKAFLAGVAFNVIANLAAIPSFGYVGAAFVTILSEVVLLIPFYYSVRQNLASVPFWSIAWRPALSSAIMGIALWVMLPRVGLLVSIPVAGILYVIILIASGALGEDERALLRRALPKQVQWITGAVK